MSNTKLEELKVLHNEMKSGSFTHESGNFESSERSKIIFGIYSGFDFAFDAYKYDDLNAAISLHKAVLPGWEYGMDSASMCWVKQPGLHTSFRNKHGGKPAYALLLSIIQALISQEEEM